MIAYVKGTLEYIFENEIIVESGGIGYKLWFLPLSLTVCHIPVTEYVYILI